MPDREDMKKEYDIRFELIDEFGNHFESRTRADSFMDRGLLAELGRCFNGFLQQASFPRKNDLIFMRDITDDEYDFLEGALAEYREREKQGL